MEQDNNNNFEYNSNDQKASKTVVETSSHLSRYGVYVGIFFIICVLIFLYSINSSKTEAPVVTEIVTEIPVKSLLSSEEVDIARISLKGSSSTDNLTSNNFEAQNTGSIDIQSLDQSELESTKSITAEEAALIAEKSKPLPPLEAVKIESSGSGVIIGDVTVVNTATEGKSSVPRTIEGLVFSIDTDNNYIKVTNPDGAYQISVNSETKFIIDNSEFDFSSLKQSDIVKIDGSGPESSKEFTASSVEVIDTFEFNSRIN